jgi:hypothetical protein
MERHDQLTLPVLVQQPLGFIVGEVHPDCHRRPMREAQIASGTAGRSLIQRLARFRDHMVLSPILTRDAIL